MNKLKQYNISVEPGKHNNQTVIFIRFPYNAQLQQRIKKLPGCKWSHTHKAWYVTDNNEYRRKFGLPPRHAFKQVLLKIHTVNQSAFIAYKEMLELKAYSPNTTKTYCNEFAQLLYVLKDKKVQHLNPQGIKSYLLYCIKALKLSENQVHSRFNAIKFYFEQVLKQEKIFLDIPRPRKPSLLPQTINAGDIKKCLQLPAT